MVCFTHLKGIFDNDGASFKSLPPPTSEWQPMNHTSSCFFAISPFTVFVYCGYSLSSLASRARPSSCSCSVGLPLIWVFCRLRLRLERRAVSASSVLQYSGAKRARRSSRARAWRKKVIDLVPLANGSPGGSVVSYTNVLRL